MKREDVLRVLEEAGCSKKVVHHVLAVEEVSLDLARRMRDNGHQINLGLVSTGALLHDIGRSLTHGIDHGVVGGRILRQLGLGKFADFAELHIGSGIPAGEAKALGLPPRDFIPRTIEEKVVAYADKLVAGGERITFHQALKEFETRLGRDHPANDRFKKLHEEILSLTGVEYDLRAGGRLKVEGGKKG